MSLIFSRRKSKGAKLSRKFASSPLPKKEYAHPASTISFLAALSAFIFLIGGGLYVWLEMPPPVLSLPDGRPVLYSPFDLSTQTSSETVFSIIFLTVGLLGGLLAYRTLRSPHSRRAGNILFIGAMVLLAIGVLGVQLLIMLKL